jgi:hypothetical protein
MNTSQRTGEPSRSTRANQDAAANGQRFGHSNHLRSFSEHRKEKGRDLTGDRGSAK